MNKGINQNRLKAKNVEKVELLTNLLIKLNSNTKPFSLTKEDKNLLTDTDPQELAFAQHNALTSGVKATMLWKLWTENNNLLPDQAANLKTRLPQNHILRRVMAEHEMFLCFITDLYDVNKKIQNLNFASSKTQEIRLLEHITSHLSSFGQHQEREDEIIFSELKRHGYTGLLDIIRDQHEELSAINHKIKKLVWQIDKVSFDYFKAQLNEFTKFIVPATNLHIFIETNILFPLAVAIIDSDTIWQKIKEISDQIGYCGYDGF